MGGLKTIDVRSMGSHHTAIVYDGNLINNDQNGTVDLGQFNPETISSMQLNTTACSPAFKDASEYVFANVLKLNTSSLALVDSSRTSFQFQLGSWENVGVNVSHLKSSSLCAFNLNAKLSHVNGAYHFKKSLVHQIGGVNYTVWDTTGVRQNGEVLTAQLTSRFLSHIGELFFRGYFSSRGIPEPIVRNTWYSSQHQDDYDFSLSYKKNLTRVYNHLLRAKISYVGLHYENPDTTRKIVDIFYHQPSFRISYSGIYSSLSSAASVSHSCLLYDDNVQSRLSLIAGVSYNPFAWLALDLGCISNQYTGSIKTSRNSLTATITFSPQFDNNLVWASVKRSVRNPTLNDLYYTEIGNTNLQTEKAINWESGYAKHFSFLSLRLTYFGNYVYDKIIAVPKGNSMYRWMMMNIGKSCTNGLTFDGTYRFHIASLKLSLTDQFTFQKCLDLSSPADNGFYGSYKGQLAYEPVISNSSHLSLSYKSFQATFTNLFVGERYHVSVNIPENYEPSYTISDVSCSFSRQNFTFLCSVNNVLDQQYEVVLNYPMPGRSFNIKLSYAF